MVKVIRSNALAKCSASNAERKRRSTTEIYFDKHVMETAILDNLQELATVKYTLMLPVIFTEIGFAKLM